MIRYFQLSKVEKEPGQCPLYENCRTGRDLPPECCAKYRCNTFYQVDTIAYGNELMKELSHDSQERRGQVRPDISRVVEFHVERKSLSGNGNGHTRKGANPASLQKT